DALGDDRQGWVDRRDVDVAVGRRLDKGPKRVEQAAQARIVREAADQGLSRDQLLRDRAQLLGRQKQEPVLFEERAAVGLADITKQLRMAAQSLRQIPPSTASEIGRARIDHDRKEVGVLREGAIQLELALTPGRVAGQQMLDIAVHAEMAEGVPGGN